MALWGAGRVLHLDLDAGYISMFSWWKFFKLCTYDTYIYIFCVCVYVLYFSKNLLEKTSI